MPISRLQSEEQKAPNERKHHTNRNPGGLLTYDGAFPIVATFFDPNNPAVPATTDFVSLRIDLVPTSGLNVSLNAFDANGQLIASSTTPDSSGAVLQVAIPGIHSVQF